MLFNMATIAILDPPNLSDRIPLPHRVGWSRHVEPTGTKALIHELPDRRIDLDDISLNIVLAFPKTPRSHWKRAQSIDSSFVLGDSTMNQSDPDSYMPGASNLP